ncbi:hypothetical protein I6E11_03260 [Bacteroides caecigallinarum]|uniref:hypothetical protein n=1 Tax=Bacteroides caecigallinarum TaxID=1411144 RepID=UPI001F262CEC|nr:hypothetical protein [Bacteroides caecigallinarum]MCF2592835.1 hypothetical protein [Bacteroides caecigallinarum]
MAEKKTNSAIKERCLLVCNYLGISASKLSQDSGMNREYIRLMKDFANADFLRYIHRTYPDIDIVWLITGEGEMIKRQSNLINTDDYITIPKEAWDIIKKQEADLRAQIERIEKRDAQIDELITMIKKDHARITDNVTCAAANGIE